MVRRRKMKDVKHIALGIILLLAACTMLPKAIKVARQYEASGNLEQAHNLIAEELKRDPRNKYLLKERLRLSKLLVRRCLTEEEQVPKGDLYRRRRLLRKAKEVCLENCAEIEDRLNEVDKKLRWIRVVLEEARGGGLPDELAALFILSPYSRYIDEVRQLRSHLKERAEELVGEIKARSSTDFEVAVALATLGCAEFPETDEFCALERTLMSSVAQKFTDLARKYEEAGKWRLMTSLFYSLCAWRILPDDDSIGRRVLDTLKRVLDQYAVGLQVEVLDSCPERVREVFLSRISELTKSMPFNKSNGPNSVRVVIACKDFGVEVSEKKETKYSDYLAGYREVPNPEYDRLLIRYNQALANAQFYALTNTFLSAWYQGVANGLAARLSRTPRYIRHKVTQSYPYELTRWEFKPFLHGSVEIVDMLHRTMIKAESFRYSDTLSEEEISGAHPDDVNGITNRDVDESALAQEILNDYLGESARKIATYVSNQLANLWLLRAVDCSENSLEDCAFDRLLAYRLLNTVGDLSSVNDITELARALSLASPVRKLLTDALKRCKSPAEVYQRARRLLSCTTITNDTLFFGNPIPAGFSQLDKVGVVKTCPVFGYADEFGLFASRRLTCRLAKSELGREKVVERKGITHPSLEKALQAVVQIRTPAGSGSGFFVNGDGYIVTNYHVVKGTEQVNVILPTGRKTTGRVVEVSISRDLAVIKVPLTEAPFIPLCPTENVKIGKQVYAVGYPLGKMEPGETKPTVTMGVVSGIRQLKSQANPYIKLTYIQTDAAVNPGNSGGPLLDSQGCAVGINAAKIVSVSVEGLGFAIASDEVLKAFGSIVAHR